MVQNWRLVDEAAAQSKLLLDPLSQPPVMGYREMDLPATPGYPQRRARLAVTLRSPRNDSALATTFQTWALRTWEERPP